MTAAAVRSASIPTFHRTTEVDREGRRPPASDLAGVPRLPRMAGNSLQDAANSLLGSINSLFGAN
jgi:hypothetical protein